MYAVLVPHNGSALVYSLINDSTKNSPTAFSCDEGLLNELCRSYKSITSQPKPSAFDGHGIATAEARVT